MKKSTSSNIIYGELGITPIKENIKIKIIAFWSKLSDPYSQKLSNQVYKILLHLYNQNKVKSTWLNNIKSLIYTNGFGYIWEQQFDFNRKWFPVVHTKVEGHDW